MNKLPSLWHSLFIIFIVSGSYVFLGYILWLFNAFGEKL